MPETAPTYGAPRAVGLIRAHAQTHHQPHADTRTEEDALRPLAADLAVTRLMPELMRKRHMTWLRQALASQRRLQEAIDWDDQETAQATLRETSGTISSLTFILSDLLEIGTQTGGDA